MKDILLFFLSFSFGRIAQLVAQHTRFINERSQVRVPGTALDSFFFLLVYDDILLACDFYSSFHSLSLRAGLYDQRFY